MFWEVCLLVAGLSAPRLDPISFERPKEMGERKVAPPLRQSARSSLGELTFAAAQGELGTPSLSHSLAPEGVGNEKKARTRAK
jgi:hypothetical protein